MAVNVKQWLEQNAASLNLSAEDRAAAERLFNGSLGTVLGAQVYPQSSVSDLQSALDRQRNEAAAERQRLEQWNLSWQDRYEADLSELGAIDKLASAGFDVSSYQANRGGGMTNTNTGESYSRAQVESLLNKQKQELNQSMEPIRTGLVDWSTFIADASAEYRETYGKRLDAKKFREYAYENRDQYPTLQSAFDAFTADDKKVKDEADRKKWEVDKEKEIEMNVMARLHIPEAAGNAADGAPFHSAKDIKPTESAPTSTQNRQEFAKKFQKEDFNITI